MCNNKVISHSLFVVVSLSLVSIDWKNDMISILWPRNATHVFCLFSQTCVSDLISLPPPPSYMMSDSVGLTKLTFLHPSLLVRVLFENSFWTIRCWDDGWCWWCTWFGWLRMEPPVEEKESDPELKDDPEVRSREVETRVPILDGATILTGDWSSVLHESRTWSPVTPCCCV